MIVAKMCASGAWGGRGNGSGADGEGKEFNLLQILISPYQNERENPTQLHPVWTVPCGLGFLGVFCALWPVFHPDKLWEAEVEM